MKPDAWQPRAFAHEVCHTSDLSFLKKVKRCAPCHGVLDLRTICLLCSAVQSMLDLSWLAYACYTPKPCSHARVEVVRDGAEPYVYQESWSMAGRA